MNRREFLRAAGLLGGAAMLGGPGLLACTGDSATRAASAAHVPRLPLPPDSMLGHPATESPVDTVVVLMMENRSFDHYLGWLGEDEGYVDDGRRRYGKDFHVNARIHEKYRDPLGEEVPTQYTLSLTEDSSPYRGCDHLGPGHSWDAGRAQRDFGFLAPGTHNDDFATSYYLDTDVPVHAQMARRFTVLDRHHASVLGPTFPNRMYLYSAQSEGLKTSPIPLDQGIYRAPTILDALDRAGVPVVEYFVDLPTSLLWGPRMFPHVRRMDAYFEDAGAGTLPNVTFVTPQFGGPYRTDNHPHGTIELGQRFVDAVFAAFLRSPQWQRGLFVLVYDEWGGFFDHVRPPVVPDERSSRDDLENFGQTGFRVPSILASPYARRGYVDHNLYDHASIIRFLEWRFLGAPPQGPGRRGDDWFLTRRDRFANNLGASLRSRHPEPGAEILTPAPREISAPCDDARRVERKGPDEVPDPFARSELLTTIVRERFPRVAYRPWLEGTNLQAVPTIDPDDAA
ncbi:MAG TPA: alkaline phosphatase family protein [Acidimicrobiia bacterium]|nr:alkaline phosphatase family protein [Acidimicrobiia bacterium]